MFADAASPALPGQRAEQGGDPVLLPGRRQGAAAAASDAGAAGAAEGRVAVVALRRERRGEIFGEEAALVRRAGSAEGAGGAQVTEHAAQVAVVRHRAPVAAVTGKPATAAAQSQRPRPRAV